MRETEFYGAMDGASSSSAATPSPAVIITAINLVGGIVIGMLTRHAHRRRRPHATPS